MYSAYSPDCNVMKGISDLLVQTEFVTVEEWSDSEKTRIKDF